jgi:hypothetical protein
MTVKARVFRLFATSVGAVLLTITLVVVPSTVDVRLLTQTLLIMGGNHNPTARDIEYHFNGALNPADPRYLFPGYNLVKVPWLAASSDSWDISQASGLAQLLSYIDYFIDDPNDKVIAYGYSASAHVIINAAIQLQAFQSQGGPSPNQVSFINVGSPYRPNGGISARFEGMTVWGMPAEGPNPVTGYSLTDIAYKYDPWSDYPQYPLMLSMLNAEIAGQYLHTQYFGPQSDLSNVIVDPNMTYYDSSTGINYITIAPPHLPLLMPLYQLSDSVPSLRPFLEYIEPTLTMLVELGYDRTIPVGQTRAANFDAATVSQLQPINDQMDAVLKDVQDALAAIMQGTYGAAPQTAVVNSSIQGDSAEMSLLSVDTKSVAEQGADGAITDNVENIEQQSRGGDIKTLENSGDDITAHDGVSINTPPTTPQTENSTNTQLGTQFSENAGPDGSKPQESNTQNVTPAAVGGLAEHDSTEPPSQNLDPGAKENDKSPGIKNDDNASGVVTTPRKHRFGSRLFGRQHTKRWKTVEPKDESAAPAKDESAAPAKDNKPAAADPDPQPKANDDAS